MRNREDAFDITKMILSIFVIGAHAGLYPDIMNPLYRITIPMFFMMSSYFFFKSLGQDKTANKARLKKFVVRNLRLYGFWFVALLPLSVMLLYAEQITVLHYGLADKTDYYFALVPCCIALFSLLRGADVHCSTAPLLRKTSTVVYVLHSSAISVLNLIGGRFLHIPEGWMAVYLTASSLMVCIAATFIILRLEKQKGFRWLRYAY